MNVSHKLHNRFIIRKNDEEPIIAYNTVMDKAIEIAGKYVMGFTIGVGETDTVPTADETDTTPYTTNWKATDNPYGKAGYNEDEGCWIIPHKVTFGLTDCVGMTVRSVAFMSSDRSVLIARCLLTDQNGQVIEIVKTDLDTIEVTYELCVYETLGPGLFRMSNYMSHILTNTGATFADHVYTGGQSVSDTSTPGRCTWTVTARLPDTKDNTHTLQQIITLTQDIGWNNGAGVYIYRPGLTSNVRYNITDETLKLDDTRTLGTTSFVGVENPVITIDGVVTTDYTYYPARFPGWHQWANWRTDKAWNANDTMILHSMTKPYNEYSGRRTMATYMQYSNTLGYSYPPLGDVLDGGTIIYESPHAYGVTNPNSLYIGVIQVDAGGLGGGVTPPTVTVEASDDLINWTTVADTVTTGVQHEVEIRQRYIRLTDLVMGSYKLNTAIGPCMTYDDRVKHNVPIIFNNPIPDGAEVKIEYDTWAIPKTEQCVLDLTSVFTIST